MRKKSVNISNSVSNIRINSINVSFKFYVYEYPAADLKFKPRRRKKDVKLSKQEMKELAALEKGEGASKLDDK
jgi:uncharacterized protein YcfL